MKQHNLSKAVETSVNHLHDSSLAIYTETKSAAQDIRDLQASVRALGIQFSETARETSTAVLKLRSEIHYVFGSEALSKTIDSAVDCARDRHFTREISSPMNLKSHLVSASRSQTSQKPLSSFRRTLRDPNTQRLSTKKTEYHTILFSVRIETTRPDLCEDLNVNLHDIYDISTNCSKTTIDIRFNPVFIGQGVHITFPSSSQRYSTRFDMQLRSYRVVSKSSPVFNALHKADIPSLRSLFKSGMASPFDVDTSGFSLLDNALSITKAMNREEPLSLIQFLLSCGAHFTPMSSHHSGRWITDVLQDEKSGPDIMRLYMDNCEHDPFGDSDMSTWISVDLVGLPAYQTLVHQEQWYVDLHNYQPSSWTGCFIENDRLMLSDAEGIGMKDAINRGMSYRLVMTGNDMKDAHYRKKKYKLIMDGIYSKPVDAPLHYILLFASSTKDIKLKHACSHRLANLIAWGQDPRKWHDFGTSYRKGKWQATGLSGQVTGVARLTNTIDVWRDGLVLAGWHLLEIEDLFDEEVYLGLEALFSGVSYSTVKENCAEFVENLAVGYYASFNEKEIDNLSIEIQSHVHGGENISVYDVRAIIKAANRAFRQLSTPGGWPGDGGIRLIPGVDFDIPDGWEQWCKE